MPPATWGEARGLAERFGGDWLAAGSGVQMGILDVLRDRLDEARALLAETLIRYYGLRPAAMNPRTTVKNVSASAACVSAAHQAATSSGVTWPACAARSIVPWLSRW